jgi:uncharacterized protein (DUF983 family)
MRRIMQEIAHPLGRSIRRGLAHRCPACGAGSLFGRYLKVEPRCATCDHELAQYPADDGPAYLTILLIGHLIVAPLLFLPIVWRSSPVYSLPILLGALLLVTLLVLPRVKGGWIGLMYAFQVTGRDARLHTADAAD